VAFGDGLRRFLSASDRLIQKIKGSKMKNGDIVLDRVVSIFYFFISAY